MLDSPTILGVANSQQPIPLCNELYPTVGMQTADEMVSWWDEVEMEGWSLSSKSNMALDPRSQEDPSPLWQIDANFGQKPFMFNIRRELEVCTFP